MKNRARQTVTLEELLYGYQKEPYSAQYSYVKKLLSDKVIEPVKSSPGNGKYPMLHTRYRYIVEKKDRTALKEELLYGTNLRISTDYYLRHLDSYEKDRKYVRLLSNFLDNRAESLATQMSENERSFSIWREEKYLSSSSGENGGARLLKRCGIVPDILNCYQTVEPFPYFTASRRTPQNILILENNDPFYGMRRHLLEGNTTVLDVSIGTLIYGGGKRALSSFREFELSAEPYMMDPGNRYLYYGDMHYEGIIIYERLANTFEGINELIPFTDAYEKMLEKAEQIGLDLLPDTKAGQKDRMDGRFLTYFDDRQVKRIRRILEERRYIPQEILTINDY